MNKEMRTAIEYAEFLRVGCWYAHAHQKDAKEMSYLTHGLSGESGEFADDFKKVIREAGFDLKAESFQEFMKIDGHTAKLRAELGDVLWYLTRLCDLLEMSLEELMVRNTYKLYRRYSDKGDRYPNQEPIEWPFTNPFHSYDNVQMNLFPEDVEDVR